MISPKTSDKSKELLTQQADVKKIIVVLKKELEEVSEQKEAWFQKKESLKKDLHQKIIAIKSLKNSLDLSKQARDELKSKRDACNKQSKDIISNIKKIQEAIKKQQKPTEKRVDPARIKKKIEELELKIETEALPIKQEKKIQEEIRTLNKIYNSFKGVKDLSQKERSMSTEIHQAKEEADVAHKAFKEKTKQERKDFKDFIVTSKAINKIKKEQEAAFKTFLKYKQEFQAKTKLLHIQFISVKKLTAQLSKVKEQKQKAQKQTQDNMLNEKMASVEEKLKTKKKITTADLLSFQKRK